MTVPDIKFDTPWTEKTGEEILGDIQQGVKDVFEADKVRAEQLKQFDAWLKEDDHGRSLPGPSVPLPAQIKT